MDKNDDIFEIIENIKKEINKERKNKKQSIKDFIKECDIESEKILKGKIKKLVYK